MRKLRAIFYNATMCLPIAYILGILFSLSNSYQMMINLALVMYIPVAFGIMLGIAFNNITTKYLFFIYEGILIVMALIFGKIPNILYLTKEALSLPPNVSVNAMKVPFIIFVVVVNIINIYITLTLGKYQKIYTKEELKEIKEKEAKLSDLREEKSEEEIREIKSKRKKLRYIAIVGIVIFFIVYFAFADFRNNLNTAFATISKLDTTVVIEYLKSFGPLTAVVSFILMILQSIAAPIPAFLITLSNAAIFGWVWGAVLSWSSAMVGAALCFFLARALGRDVVEKLTSKGAMESVDVFFERYGKYAILICRLLPFVSFDFVSYGAGLTNMGFWSFFIATGIGQLPATIVYSYVGGTLSGGAQKLFVGLLSLFALSIVIGIIKKIYNDKHKVEKEKGIELPTEE